MYQFPAGAPVRITIENLNIDNVAAYTTTTYNVAIPTAQLASGDGISITPRGTKLNNGAVVYGHFIDSTHLGVDVVNPTNATINFGTGYDFDVYVSKKSGSAAAAV